MTVRHDGSRAVTRALVLRRRRKGRRIGESRREVQRRLEAAGWQVDSLVVRRNKTWFGVGSDEHWIGDSPVREVLVTTKTARRMTPISTSSRHTLGVVADGDSGAGWLLTAHARRHRIRLLEGASNT